MDIYEDQIILEWSRKGRALAIVEIHRKLWGAQWCRKWERSPKLNALMKTHLKLG